MADNAMQVWAEGLLKGPALQHVNAAKSHALAFGQGVRSSGEGVIVGGLLGVANAIVPGGLDQHVGMLPKPIPIDGVVGGAALLACVALGADSAASVDAANAAGIAFGILSFRKMQDFIHERQIGPSAVKAALKGKATVKGEGLGGISGAGPRGPGVMRRGRFEPSAFGAEGDPVLKAAFSLDEG